MKPTEAALARRARALLAAMSERARFVYALPPGLVESAIEPILLARGLRIEEHDAAAGVRRFSNEAQTAAFVVFDSAELESTLVEAAGPEAARTLAELLDKTGFLPQSGLLGAALELGEPQARKALRTLAHMVVAWDEDWTDLFLLHLACPDPIVRHDAAVALTVAAMVSRETAPAIELLRQASERERYPRLESTFGEAIALLQALSGAPVAAVAAG